MKKYIIMSQYEFNGPNGKQMTDWFVLNSNLFSKEEADEFIEEVKIDYDIIDKKTKLNHFYKKVLKSDYDKEREELMSKLIEAKKKQEEYYKSDAYKELKKKKRKAAKELKEHQKKYILEHNNDK